MIKAVLFDLDGTLVDNMGLHYESLREAVGERKKIEPIELFLNEGGNAVMILSELLSDLNLEEYEIERIFKKKKKIFRKTAAGITMRPEAGKLIRKLRKLNYKIGLVTGSGMEVVDFHLSSRDRSLFHQIITGDDIEKPKPDPESYVKCAEALRVRPEECIVIENAPLGIESAKSAGMICIALLSTVTEEYLKRADFVIKNMAEAEDIIKKL